MDIFVIKNAPLHEFYYRLLEEWLSDDRVRLGITLDGFKNKWIEYWMTPKILPKPFDEDDFLEKLFYSMNDAEVERKPRDIVVNSKHHHFHHIAHIISYWTRADSKR